MPPIIDDRATTTTSAPRRGRIVDDTAAPEQPSGLRRAASIAVPMAMQVGAGLATAPLLAAGPAGVAAYGAANVGAGVAAERTRQAILGEEPNYKTAALTGALNVIPLPGVRQGASALGAIGRTGGAAAALGAGEEVGRAYLEDRPITLENLLAGGAISGAVGGAMGGAAQGLANRRVAAPNPEQIQAVTPPDAPQSTGKGKIVDDIAPDGQGALPFGERPRGPVATWDAEGRKLVLGPDGKPVQLQGDQQQIAEQNQAVTQLQPSAQLAADLAEIERLRAENARLKGEPQPKPSVDAKPQPNQQLTGGPEPDAGGTTALPLPSPPKPLPGGGNNPADRVLDEWLARSKENAAAAARNKERWASMTRDELFAERERLREDSKRAIAEVFPGEDVRAIERTLNRDPESIEDRVGVGTPAWERLFGRMAPNDPADLDPLIDALDLAEVSQNAQELADVVARDLIRLGPSADPTDLGSLDEAQFVAAVRLRAAQDIARFRGYDPAEFSRAVYRRTGAMLNNDPGDIDFMLSRFKRPDPRDGAPKADSPTQLAAPPPQPEPGQDQLPQQNQQLAIRVVGDTGEVVFHGTDQEGAAQLLKAGRFDPSKGRRKYDYSEMGPDTSYFARNLGGMFLDPQKAAEARAMQYGAIIQARLKPGARVVELRSDAEWEKLAQAAGLTESDVDALFTDGLFEEGASIGQDAGRKAVAKIRALGVDAIDVPESVDMIGSTDVQRGGRKQILAGGQIAVLNNDVVEPVGMAGEPTSKPNLAPPAPRATPTFIGSRTVVGGGPADPSVREFAQYLPQAREVPLKDGTVARLVSSVDTEGLEGRVVAFDQNGALIGDMAFSLGEESPGVRINPDVFVVEGARRKGVATALYDFAEDVGGLIPAVDQAGQVRSEEGSAFRRARAGLLPEQPRNSDPLPMLRELAQTSRLIGEAVDLLQRGGTPETRQPLTPESVIASLRDAVEFRGANPKAADAAIDEVALAFGLPPQKPLARPSTKKQKTLKEVLNPAPAIPARQVQGLTDNAPDPGALSPRDIERHAIFQSRPVGRPVRVRSIARPREMYEMRFRLASLDDFDLNDPRVQPRNRDERRASDIQVAEIARDPRAAEWLEGSDILTAGTPIIGPDGLPEGGNGRLTGIRQARANNPQAYAQFQAEQRARAAEFGLDPTDFDSVPSPIIVRERVSPVKSRLDFADETNDKRQLGMSPAEKALRDAAKIPNSAIDALEISEGQTLDQALKLKGNNGLVRAFLSTMPLEAQAELLTRDGVLNAAGMSRLKAALVARAFPGALGEKLSLALSESTDSGVKNAEAGLVASAGQFAKSQQIFAEYPEVDIGDDLAWAVSKLAALRAADQSTETYFRTPSMPGMDDRTPRRDMLLAFLSRAKSGKAVREGLSSYLAELEKLPPASQGTLGGMANKVDANALLQNALPTATIGDMLGNQKGGTPIFGDIARWLLGRGEPGGTQPTTQSRPLSDQAASRQQSLEREALPKVQGAAPAPNPAIEILDEFGRPIRPTGALSSDDPARLAPSMLGVDRDKPTGFNIGQIVAEDSSVDFGNARRNVQSWGQLDQAAQGVFLRLAARADESPETYWKSLRRRGETFNSETIVALGRWADDLDRKLATDSARALQSGDPEAIARVVDQLKGEYKGVRMQEAAAAAEGGRALQAYRKVKQQREATQADIRRILATEGVSPEQLEEFMRAILAAGDDPIAVGKVRQAARGGLWEQVVKYRMAFMLSGIKTHVANVGGNTGALSKRLLDRPAGGAIDAARAVLTGTPRTRYMGEVLADIEGMTAPVRTANRKAIETFEKKKAAAAGSLWGQGEGAIEAARVWLRTLRDNPASLQSKFDSPVTYARTRIGRIAELPLRALRLEDDVFKSAAYYGDLHALAYRQAATEGVSGYRNRIARAREILAGPIPAEMIEAATQEALYRTFQGEAGDFTRRAMGLRNWAPLNGRIKPVELIVPFLRTPVKLGAFAAENSPLGAMHLAWHAAQGNLSTGEIVDQAAKIATGTMAATAFFMLAKQGLIKGSGPSDPGEQRAWREAGNKPYTAYLGDDVGWVDYSRLDPVAMLIGTTADAAELSTVESDDALAKVGFAFGRNFLSKQYISGLADFLDAVQDPDRHAAKWSQGIAQSFTPAIVAHLGAAKDPYLREAGSMEETLRLRSPLQSDRAPVPIVRDIWGEPVTIAGGFVEKLISPFPRSRPKTDPASLEIARLGYAPGSPAKALGITGTEWKGKIAMTPDEYERFVVLSGQRAKHYVNTLIQLPSYKALAGRDAEQAEQIAKQFSAARREVRQEMKAPLAERAARQGLINPQTFQMRVPDLRKQALR